MVSKNATPPVGLYLDPNEMALPGLGPFASVATAATTTVSTTSSVEELSKKIRKPYTITKSRESWTEPEHDKFLEALQLFGSDWNKIEAFIGSKTVIQVMEKLVEIVHFLYLEIHAAFGSVVIFMALLDPVKKTRSVLSFMKFAIQLIKCRENMEVMLQLK